MITPDSFQLELFRSTHGAISVCEMLGIMNVSSQAPLGTCAEMGSHRGKSGIAAAIGLSQSSEPNRILHMVDPLYNLENIEAWKHTCQGHPDKAWEGARDDDFHGIVQGRILDATSFKSGEITVSKVIAQLHGDYSLHAIPDLHSRFGSFAYVFIDSDQHTYELCKAECDLLRDKMAIGGIICFHDFGNQFLGVEQVYREMIQNDVFREISIPWDDIRKWVRENGGESGNSSWHMEGNPEPCFVGAIKFMGEKK